MSPVSPLTVAPEVEIAPLAAGDYFSTDRDLYRVEEVHGDFAMIEDCRSEFVLDVAVDEILAMTPVRRAA